MTPSLKFLRIFFVLLSVFFMTTFMVTCPPDAGSGACAVDFPLDKALIGILLGLAFGALLIGVDILFRRFNLRALNILVVGLLFGYLLGHALVLSFGAIMTIGAKSVALRPDVDEIIRIALYLFGLYLGTLFTLKSADEIYVSIPFVKLSPSEKKRKDLLIDISVLKDGRLKGLVHKGLFHHTLIFPRFLERQLYTDLESENSEEAKSSKEALALLKDLGDSEEFGLRTTDTDFSEEKDPIRKMTRLAHLLDANWLNSDLSSVQVASIQAAGVKVISMHDLSAVLSPVKKKGDRMKVSPNRVGNAPGQAIADLENGGIVVVNGGAAFMNKEIEVEIIGVKTTDRGTITFANAPNGNHHD